MALRKYHTRNKDGVITIPDVATKHREKVRTLVQECIKVYMILYPQMSIQEATEKATEYVAKNYIPYLISV